MASSADHYAATTPYDPPPRHSRANSRASQACRGSEPLPRYPSAQEATTKADAGEPALPKVKKEASAAPLDVDGFSAEIGRLQYDLTTVKADLGELARLYDRALAVPASTSSRCVTTHQLYRDIEDLSRNISSTFSPLPPSLRALASKAPLLRGGAGRVFVLASEAAEITKQIGRTAVAMKECMQLVDQGVARGARVQAVSPTYAQTIPNPFSAIKEAYIAEAGPSGVAFLDKIDTTKGTAADEQLSLASWFNPFAYSLPGYSAAPAAADAQDAQGDQSRPLLKAGDEEEGPWGEKISPKEVLPYSRKRLALIMGALLMATTGVSVGLIFWSRHSYVEPTAS